MSKAEFLNILRQTLEKEVSPEVIEQNVSYYDQYIGNRSEEEMSKIMNDLGDPRLLAKTIIETEKMARQRIKFKDKQNYENSNQDEEIGKDNQNDKSPYGRNMFFTKLSWYHKVTLAIILVLLFILLAIIGRILIVILVTFGVPILLVCFLLILFRKR